MLATPYALARDCGPGKRRPRLSFKASGISYTHTKHVDQAIWLLTHRQAKMAPPTREEIKVKKIKHFLHKMYCSSK